MIDPLSGIIALIISAFREKTGVRGAAPTTTNATSPKPTFPYSEPHRDPVTGAIRIDNEELYHQDVEKYGLWQAQQWIKEGKYNLSPEELEKAKEEARIKEESLTPGQRFQHRYRL